MALFLREGGSRSYDPWNRSTDRHLSTTLLSQPYCPIPVPLSLPSRCVLSLALAPVSCLPSLAACLLHSLDDPAIRPGCAEYDLSIVGSRT